MGARQGAWGVLQAMAISIAAVALTGEAAAEQYPSRPIEIIVTWGPGGGADQTARMLARLLEQELKVSFPVENVPGSAGVTGLNKLLSGQAEGYQLGLLTADTLMLRAAPRPPRWKLQDLAPIAVLIKQPSGFFVRADGPLQTWADVETAARETELKVAVTGLNTPDELAVEQLKKRGLKLLSVPFANPGERYAAVLGGHADLVYEQAGDMRSFVENKQIKPVLFLATERVDPFTDVPTTRDLGIDLVLDQFRTIMAKSGTPPERLKLLQDSVAKVAASKEYKEFLANAWADPNSVTVGDEAMEYVKFQIESLKKIWQ